MPWVTMGSVVFPITACPPRTAAGTAELGTSISVTSRLASSFHFASRYRMIEFGVPLYGPTAIDLPLK